MSTTHIAGLAVLLGKHGRQRCAWCGEMLFEVTGDEMGPVGSDGSPPEPLKPWPQGAFIQVTKDGPVTAYVVIPDSAVPEGDIPLNACAGPPKLRLVEAPK